MNFRSYINAAACYDLTLYYAVLAVAAKHRNLGSAAADPKADEYQRRCLETLIPALNDDSTVLAENILACALILRLLEEMTGMLIKKWFHCLVYSTYH